jgi:hypothetical protein
MEEYRFSDSSEIQRAMPNTFRNVNDGCRIDGMLLQFLSHPEVYLRVETAAKVRQFAAEENQEFIEFMNVGDSFPANRIGKYLPAYIRRSSR